MQIFLYWIVCPLALIISIGAFLGTLGFYLEEYDTCNRSDHIGFISIMVVCVGFISFPAYHGYYYFIYDYPKAVDEAIAKFDFERANSLLLDMSNNNRQTNDGASWSTKNTSNYTIAFERVMKAQISYLVNQGDQIGSDKIISLIMNLPQEATPTIGHADQSAVIKENDRYIRYASKVNALCDEVMSYAISTNNKYLAEKIITLYKPLLSRRLIDSHVFSSDEYMYEYTDEAKMIAMRRLNEALSSGKLK